MKATCSRMDEYSSPTKAPYKGCLLSFSDWIRGEVKPSENLAIRRGSSFGINGSALSDSQRLGSTEKPPRLGIRTLLPVVQWLHFPQGKGLGAAAAADDDDDDDDDNDDVDDEDGESPSKC